jgi:hypothetical protein
MTKPYYTHRGVVKTINRTCGECAWRSSALTGVEQAVISCHCENSSHFFHILDPSHPACKHFEIVEIGDKTDDR